MLLYVGYLSVYAQNLSKAEVVKRYSAALTMMTKGNRQYAEARRILMEISPHADENLRTRILQKIPMSWYFEGTLFQLEQKYGEALACMEKARYGFHEIGETKNEIEALYRIGSIKNYTYAPKDAIAAYEAACALAASAQYDKKLMEILREQRKLSEQLGDSKQTLSIGQRMDSLAAATDDKQVRFTYYNYLGDVAKEQGNYKLSEQWYRKNNAYINQLSNNYKGADRYLYYSNLRNLFAKAGKLDDALRYAILSKDEFQGITDISDKNYYMPYLPSERR